MVGSKGRTIEVQVLGALRVVEDDHPVDLGGPRQRRLLAALVLADGAPVSTDRLVDAVFGDEASPSAGDTLRSYVTRLRRALSQDGRPVVVRDGHGYRLVGDAVDLDAERFGHAVTAARRARDRGAHDEAAGLLRDALAAWRGNAYDDLADEPWVAPAARRLDESRQVAQELLAEALTSAGRAPEAVDVLRDVLAADPYREGAVGGLMLALYRSGRPADALAEYRGFATRVAGELGIDPGPALQRLHEQVLARDPQLDASTSAPTVRGYELRERLGRGRQGTVYAACMPGVNRDYAIRVYDPEVADAPSTLATFDADVRLLVTLDEPTLVPVYDGWREPGAATLVMRRMSGTLADVLRRGPLTPHDARDVVQRTGRALVALARRGRRHGRVEPSSVLTDEAGHAYLSEPVLGPSSAQEDDAEGFLRLARACLPEQPPGWWDGLDPNVLDAIAMVAEVLARLEAPSLRPENPYVGLRPFEAADADRYFGREHVVAALVDRVLSDPVVMLVGGSGSGKSSIVRAGLVPYLRGLDPPWTTTVMVPGARPMQHLADALQRVQTAEPATGRDTPGGVELARGSPAGPAGVTGIALTSASRRASGRLLLVVDQMEELFTVAEAAERERFLAVLAQCASGVAGDIRVVATVRADYFDHPLDHPVFGGIAARAALAVPPMSAADLERTIVGPADGRLEVDDGLTTELVTAVVGEPGALPALQFTLRELAERGGTALRRGDLLALGGVEGAIAHRAEQMYAALDLPGQQTLRQVLQRMVVVDESGEPSRRTVPRAELVALGPAADGLLEEWIEGRLLTTGRRPDTREPTVTLAHEAVLTRWPRLREWVDEDRERLLAMARLTQAAQEWADLGHDPAALPRGGRLEQAEQLTRAAVAPTTVQAFVEAAQSQRADEQRQAAEAVEAEARTSRRLRRQRWMLAVALVAAIAVGWVALEQRGAAVAAAERQRERADAGASSLIAASGEASRSDWARALLLAAEAHRLSPSADTRRHLLALLAQPRPIPTLAWSSEESLRALVVDPETGWAAVQWTGGPLDVIDLDQGRRVRGAQARGEVGFDMRDGLLVFGDTSSGVGRVRVLDDSGDRVVSTLPDGVDATDIEISPSGRQVAVADTSGRVRLLSTGTWEPAGTLSGLEASAIQRVAWDESAGLLHAFDVSGRYLAWDLAAAAAAAEPAAPLLSRDLTSRDALQGVEKPADIDLGVVDLELVAGAPYLSVVSTRDGPFWVDTEAVDFVYTVGRWLGRGSPLGGAVTPDGGHIIVGGSLMEVYRPGDDPLDLRGTAVSWNAVDVDVVDDGTAVTVGSDGNVTTWHLPERDQLAATTRVPALDGSPGVVVSPEGHSMLLWDDARAVVLDGTSFVPQATIDIGAASSVLGSTFLPGGDRVVTHVCTSTPEHAWEPCDSALMSHGTDGALVAGPVDAGPARPSQGASVVAGGDVVATVDADGAVTVRDPATLEARERLRAADAPDDPDSSSLSISPDGQTLVVSTSRPQSVTAWRLGSDTTLLVSDTAGLPGIEAYNDYPDAYGGMVLSDESVLVAGYDAFRLYGTHGGEPLAVYPDPVQTGDVLASEVLQQDMILNGIDGLTTSPSLTSDASLLLTGVPGAYWLWDPAVPLVLAGPIDVERAVVDPTGDRLFVWRGEEAFVLSLHPDDLVAAACEAAGRSLTEQEWARSIGAGEPYDPVCSGATAVGS